MRVKIVRIMWCILGGGFAICSLLTVAVWNGWIGYMPDVEDLQNPLDRYASQIYSADGVLIGTWSQSKDNRILVPYDSISPNVIHALVATEDERYYEHSGVDFIALSRAIIKRGFLGQESAGGGSTITQQLAKQLFSEQAESKLQRLFQKPVEWIIALKLERNYTKSEIIAMYLNKFDFLHNAVGIKMASNVYFSKEPINLTVPEAALLVGLCKNPSMFNPIRFTERCKERRNVVLGQMLKAGYLSESEYDDYAAEDIKLKYHAVDHKDGQAPYFREYLRKYMMAEEPKREDYPSWAEQQFQIDLAAWKNDPLYGWCNKNLKKDGTPYNIYTDGLKIYTTIDSRMQKYAEQSVYAQVARYLQPKFNQALKGKPNAPFSENITWRQIQSIMKRSMRQSDRWRSMREAGLSDEEIKASFFKKTEMTIFTYRGEIDTLMTPYDSIRYIKTYLRSGFVSIDPSNGYVKAYVGGLDFNHFQYDMAFVGRRQVGSTIKPLLYAMAMDNGMTPCDVLPNASAYPGWHVQHAGGGGCTLRRGLQQSLNGISTQLMKRFSNDGSAFLTFMGTFGINTATVKPNPTLCLGSCEISVGEMVSAYTTFANNGIHAAPIFVTKITDNEGNVIANFEPRLTEVISAEAAYKMIDILRSVAQGGTASRLRYKFQIESDLGAKTGTTNNNSDAWFIGFTPQLVSGCWVGGEDRDIHFDNMAMAQGAAAALPIWAYYMKKIYRDPTLPYDPEAKFDIPEDFNACRKDDAYGDNKIGEDTDDFESVEDVYQ